VARRPRLRIGVTGHRAFEGVTQARAAATRVVAALRDQHGGLPLEVWSSLAEGADRLVVEAVRACDPTARLVAVLPLQSDDYRADFVAPGSAAEFDRLLSGADDTSVTGPDASGTRESAYARAGLAVVDGVDVLVAVWDGEPVRGTGGTAEIIAAARAAGREVVVIPVTRPAVAT
jgi:hypothetical protein